MLDNGVGSLGRTNVHSNKQNGRCAGSPLSTVKPGLSCRLKTQTGIRQSGARGELTTPGDSCGHRSRHVQTVCLLMKVTRFIKKLFFFNKLQVRYASFYV
jgi:hypothetical protein